MRDNLFTKTLGVFLFCAIFSVGVNAQNVFSKGDNNLNLGIGIGSVLGGTAGYSTTTPPLSVSYERGIVDQLFDDKSSLGIGAYLGYASNKSTLISGGNNFGWKYNYTIFGVRGALHYQLVDKLDTYAGLMLGYNSVSSTYYGDNSLIQGSVANGSGMGWSLFIGGRYYFTDNVAAFAELGYGIAYLQLGVSFKF
jgi:hypothetical protein